MRILGRQLTSPRVDAVVLLLIGFSLVDLAAVPLAPFALPAASLALRFAIGAVGVACFVAAGLRWRRAA